MASRCSVWPKPTARSMNEHSGPTRKVSARSVKHSNLPFAPPSLLRRRIRWEDGDIRRTPTTPTPRSAAPCWLACWRLATPGSKSRPVDRQGNRLLQADDRSFGTGCLCRRHGWVRRIDRPDLDRFPGFRRGPPQGLARIQGDGQLPQAAARAAIGPAMDGIRPLLPGSGALPGRYRRLG